MTNGDCFDVDERYMTQETGNRKKIYHRKRDVNTFAYLCGANKTIFEGIDEKRAGWIDYCLVSLVLSAFTFEAFLNHLGSRIVPDWQSVDRKPMKEKLKLIAKHLGVQVKHRTDPWRTVTQLQKFRDQIAHGRSESLNDEVIRAGETKIYEDKPETEWEKFCTEEKARRCFDCVLEAMRVLNVAAGFDEYPETDFGLMRRWSE